VSDAKPKLPSASPTICLAYNSLPEAERQNIDWALIERYLPLVRGIVARMGIYFNTHVDMEDVYSVGVSGLISAVQRYKVEKSHSFVSYAALRIKGAILDELRRMDWMPRSARASAKKLRKTIEGLEARLQRAATEDEISHELGLDKGQYTHLLDQVRPLSFVPIDAPVGPGAEGGTMNDFISDATELNAREKTESKEVIELMRSRIESLPELQRKILSMYYFEGLRLAEIAEIFHLSEARICQIHTQTVLALRAYLDSVHARVDVEDSSK
jgi:RNA polymerase sigma factor FliA